VPWIWHLIVPLPWNHRAIVRARGAGKLRVSSNQLKDHLSVVIDEGRKRSIWIDTTYVKRGRQCRGG